MNIYWLWLAKLPGIGPVTANKLIEYFSAPKDIYNAKEQELTKILKPAQIKSVMKERNLDKIEKEWNRLDEKRFVLFTEVLLNIRNVLKFFWMHRLDFI